MDRKRANILFIGMALVTIVILIGTGAYAYYRTTISGTTSGTIAKWSFKANNQTESFSINLGKVYPGKTGTYNIELSAEDSDLDVYYELVFKDFSNDIYWDINYTKPLYGAFPCESYVGRYGIIPSGEKTTIVLYYNWPYGNKKEDYKSYEMTNNIEIIAKQYSSYNGTIPINILNNPNITNFEELNNISGYIIGKVPC